MTDDNKPLIDASIFGGVGVPAGNDGLSNEALQAQVDAIKNSGGIPDFLVRKANEHDVDTEAAVAGPATSEANADDVDGQRGDEHTGDAGSASGTAANHDGYPTEMTEAGEQHTLINPNATLGHNQPEEEPLSKEDMLKDFNKDIAAYGKDSGRGASALPRLGLRVIRAAADGLISTEKPKDGSDSDAVRIYKRYAEQDSKHAEHTKGGMKANAAKLNALIGLGTMTTVDGVEVAQRCVDLREKMEGAEQKPKALFAGLVDVARKQMEQDTPLTDDAIEAALGKTVKEKTVADEWAAIHKKIEKLISGDGDVKDQSESAVKIEEMVREHVNNFTVNAEREELVAFCMERGMSRAQANEFVAK
jgi:hypothetical protein